MFYLGYFYPCYWPYRWPYRRPAFALEEAEVAR